MRSLIICFGLSLIVFLSTDALAFRSSGDVNDYLKYKRLEVGESQVCGVIENTTRQHIYIFADVIFESRTKYIDRATIHIKVPPREKRKFCDYLNRGGSGAQDALIVKWDVYMLTVDGEKKYIRDSIY